MKKATTFDLFCFAMTAAWTVAIFLAGMGVLFWLFNYSLWVGVATVSVATLPLAARGIYVTFTRN